MDLAGVVVTYNSEKRIETLLRSMRLFCDELVVVVDERSDDGTFDICQGLADQVVRWNVPLGMSLAVKEEAFSLPKSDWAISLDDDELISEAILDHKRGILEAREDVSHFLLPLYSLVEDERHYIASLPLWPQYVPCVFRRGMAIQEAKLLHHPLSAKEGSGVFLFPVRIFHYKFLLRGREERERRWEVMRTKPCYMDVEFFRQFYLYEDYNFKIGTIPEKPLRAEGNKELCTKHETSEIFVPEAEQAWKRDKPYYDKRG